MTFDYLRANGKHPNRQCGEIFAVRIIIRFSQHDVLMALPSVFALHPIFSHSVIYGTLCNLNLKGPSRYRPEVDLRLNAQINLGSFQHNVCHKDELTLFLPLGRVYPEKCTHKKSSPKKTNGGISGIDFCFFQGHFGLRTFSRCRRIGCGLRFWTLDCHVEKHRCQGHLTQK